MIVQLTGTLVEVLPTTAVLDVDGVGYELGISANTAASLPQAGEAGVTLLTRMIVSQDAVRLYGFATKEERALFDRLVQVAGVGPRLALSVLSTFTPAELYAVVAADDAAGMSRVPGVGKKTAHRLILELQGVFAKDPVLMGLAGKAATEVPAGKSAPLPLVESPSEEVTQALLSMGFTPKEAELALKGADEAGAVTVEAALSYALKRLGGGI
jgi:Holliday junction DNA helicase RuvA